MDRETIYCKKCTPSDNDTQTNHFKQQLGYHRIAALGDNLSIRYWSQFPNVFFLALVAASQWKHMTDLLDRENYEGASPGRLRDDGNVFGVDGTAVRVVGILRYLHAFVALFLLRRDAVHVPKLGAAHMERHLNEARNAFFIKFCNDGFDFQRHSCRGSYNYGDLCLVCGGIGQACECMRKRG